MRITWKDEDDNLAWPIRIEKKIDIFYQQALGWQLHIADLVVNGGLPLDGGTTVQAIKHSGFAVLQICLSYFETIGKYQAPKGSTRKTTSISKRASRPSFRLYRKFLLKFGKSCSKFFGKMRGAVSTTTQELATVWVSVSRRTARQWLTIPRLKCL